MTVREKVEDILWQRGSQVPDWMIDNVVRLVEEEKEKVYREWAEESAGEDI